MIHLYPFIIVTGLLCEAAVVLMTGLLMSLGLPAVWAAALFVLATVVTFAGAVMSAVGMHQKQVNILVQELDPQRFIQVYEPLLPKAAKQPAQALTMHAYLSTAYANLGQFDRALQLLDACPAVQPADRPRAEALLLGNRCLILFQQGKTKQALDCLTRLESRIKADRALGEDVELSARLLRARADALKGWAGDLERMRRVAAGAQPPFYAAANQELLGRMLLAAGKPDEARAALERAAAFGDTIWAGREAARLLRDMAQGEG